MTFVEIRYKPTDNVILGFAKLQLDLNQEESIDFVKDLFTNSVDHIYLKTIETNEVIKLQRENRTLIKSFILDFLELDKIFQ